LIDLGETRSTKSETNSKSEIQMTKTADVLEHLDFGPLNLFRISWFGFRILQLLDFYN